VFFFGFDFFFGFGGGGDLKMAFLYISRIPHLSKTTNLT
jgi:hypothetical protein